MPARFLLLVFMVLLNRLDIKLHIAHIENIFDMTKYIAIILRYIIIIIVLFLNILCVIL